MKNGMQFGFGLRMLSDLPVPGAIPGSGSDMGPEIRISLLPERKPSAEPGFSLEPPAIVYRHPCGQFHCTADRIEVLPDDQVSRQDLGELLVANALPALLWLRGAFMLHAACLRLPHGPVLAIAGPSGSGKSRLAAGLVGAGAELIGDDSLALTVTGRGVNAAGLPGGWFARSPDGTERHFRSVAAAPARGEALLNTLIVLGEGDDAIRLSPIGAIEQLLLNRHRPQVPLLLGRPGEVLAQASKITRMLPIACANVQFLVEGDPLAACTAVADLAQHGSCVRPDGMGRN